MNVFPAKNGLSGVFSRGGWGGSSSCGMVVALAGSAAGYFWSGVVKRRWHPVRQGFGSGERHDLPCCFFLFFIAIEVSMEVNFTFVILFTSMEANLLPK